MKKVIKEYLSEYVLDIKDQLRYKNCNDLAANARSLRKEFGNYYIYSYGLTYNSRGARYHEGKVVYLPKRYYYSSGKNSLIGYK